MTYEELLICKTQLSGDSGFAPLWLPDILFDFQKSLVDWALRKGRGAILAGTGLGKTVQQLVWAENIVRRENKRVLVLAPLAVTAQTVQEGQKFGIEVIRSRDGKLTPGAGITVTNYDQLHKFDKNDFIGVVCDESAAIKSFGGERQISVTEFMRKMPYRLLCSAAPAPNDFIELGTSAEALGELGRMDMLSRFFKNDENSNHPIWWGARWRFKQHAEREFWRWVCSWARVCQRPSDLGFDDGPFILPPLIINETIVSNNAPLEGYLFKIPAVTLHEQRKERRQTMQARCDAVLKKVGHTKKAAVVWCHLNPEGDLLEKIIPGAMQVSGKDSDEAKEEILTAFALGQVRVLVIKPVIGAWGLNWQHCHHMTFFPSHSWEQYFQGVRRCWRFGQTHPVTVDIITSEGEQGVQANLQRKSDAADTMFAALVREMNHALRIEHHLHVGNKAIELPEWARIS